MVLKAITKITQSANSRTQYVTIPADLVKDSQYPFSANEEVEIRVILGQRKLELVGTGKNKTTGVTGEGERSQTR